MQRLRRWVTAIDPALRWLVFDILFGIVAPIFCLANDIILFADEGLFGGDTVLGWLRVFAYLAIAGGMLTLVIWLAFSRFLGVGSSVVAGILLVGAPFASIIGIILLPWSVVGLVFVGLGLLGFVPFVTAIVYYRNGRRAWDLAQQASVQHPTAIKVAAVLGAVLVLGIPAVMQWLDHQWGGTLFWYVGQMLRRSWG
jgi:hypothetical protein